MDIVTGKILRLNHWPDGRIIGLAKRIGAQLSDMDEAPQAYKPIDSIIAAQNDLVDVIGKFMPRIVRIADEAGEY